MQIKDIIESGIHDTFFGKYVRTDEEIGLNSTNINHKEILSTLKGKPLSASFFSIMWGKIKTTSDGSMTLKMYDNPDDAQAITDYLNSIQNKFIIYSITFTVDCEE